MCSSLKQKYYPVIFRPGFTAALIHQSRRTEDVLVVLFFEMTFSINFIPIHDLRPLYIIVYKSFFYS